MADHPPEIDNNEPLPPSTEPPPYPTAENTFAAPPQTADNTFIAADERVHSGGLRNKAYRRGGRRALAIVKRFEEELKELHEWDGSQVAPGEIGMIGGAYNAWVRRGSRVPGPTAELTARDYTALDNVVFKMMVAEMLNLEDVQDMLAINRPGRMSREQLEYLETWEWDDKGSDKTTSRAFHFAKQFLNVPFRWEPVPQFREEWDGDEDIQ